MQGLKTRETKKFNRYFELVQIEAAKVGSVFFLDAGDGNDFETETMEGEELMGWLIPADMADEFNKEWMQDCHNVSDKWNDYFLWAEWSITDGVVSVSFVSY